MIPTLAQVCSLESSFKDDVADYAAGKCESIELWLTKLETYLQSHTIDDVRRLFEQHGVRAPVASFQGGLLDSQGERRREAWKLLGRRLVLCEQLGVETLVVACDVAEPLSQQTIERVGVSLAQLAQEAGKRGVRAALEFQAKSTLGNNLQTAASLVAQVGSPALGLCLDAFHYFVGPSQPEDLGLLSRENLFHVHLSDLLDVPRELASDSDRILPGDGDIPLEPILHRLREIDYPGPVSIELMNPQIWRISPLQFGEVGITALRKLLGLADPS
jgi:4-hydroxyphenylpyruvate dioxygenase